MNNIVTTNQVNIQNYIDDIKVNYPSHPYHLTQLSPWPIVTSTSVFAILAGMAIWFNSIDGAGVAVLMGIASLLGAVTLWFTDVSNEGTLLGLHTRIVQHAHTIGFALFVTTEAIFFVSIF